MTPNTREHAGDRSKPAPRLDVRFALSATGLANCPPREGPEVAFAGRSNAGKSSVLNRLTGNRRTAKVSKTPGRTRQLNFFSSPGGGYVVDLPGYGYAKAGRDAQAGWQAAVNDYLSHRDTLAAIVLVMDIRHPSQPFDQELIDWAHASDLPMLILLNKADKLKQGARQRVLRQVAGAVAALPTVQVACFSAQTGLGAVEVVELIKGWLTPTDP